jgi:RNA polymerase sigma-70 factor (ECF subfamily)
LASGVQSHPDIMSKALARSVQVTPAPRSQPERKQRTTAEENLVHLDAHLVSAARAGDHEAFRELVRRHQRKAYAVALGIVRDADDARDVVQDAFLKVHEKLDTFDGDAQFFTWLYRIVANLAIDHLRKRRRPRVDFDESYPQETEDTSGISPARLGFDPARALTDRELRERILAALDELSPSHRAVLVMREVDGLSYQEMADVVGCSIGTIMSRLFHARKRMQALLCDLH